MLGRDVKSSMKFVACFPLLMRSSFLNHNVQVIIVAFFCRTSFPLMLESREIVDGNIFCG